MQHSEPKREKQCRNMGELKINYFKQRKKHKVREGARKRVSNRWRERKCEK